MVETDTWRPNDSVVFSPLEGGVALLDTTRNIYYTLDGIGPFLWEQLAGGSSFAGLCDAVEGHYDVPSEVASADISDWLAEMAAAGLVVGPHD